MAVLHYLSRRSVSTPTISPLARNFILTLTILFALILLGFSILFILRSYRKRRFPSYNTSTVIIPPLSQQTSTLSATLSSKQKRNSHHRRHGALSNPPSKLDLSSTRSEKEMLFDSSEEKEPWTPDSLPEITITFPDDEDEGGVKGEEKVMRITVGEKGAVGLEPCRNNTNTREKKILTSSLEGQKMETLDLDRIGGLKEKM